MRLGIKGKQVLGVTSIVGAVVVLLSLLYLAGLARVSLEESRARAELVANAIFHRRARVAQRRAPDPAAAYRGAARRSRSPVDSRIEPLLQERHVRRHRRRQRAWRSRTPIPRAKARCCRSGGDPRSARRADRRSRSCSAIYSGQGQNLEFRQPLRLGDTDFGSIRIGVSTLLVRQDLDASLGPAIVTAGAGAGRGGHRRDAARAAAAAADSRHSQRPHPPWHAASWACASISARTTSSASSARSSTPSARSCRRTDRRWPGQVANLESAVQHLEDAVAIVNPRGELLFANPAMRALLPGRGARHVARAAGRRQPSAARTVRADARQPRLLRAGVGDLSRFARRIARADDHDARDQRPDRRSGGGDAGRPRPQLSEPGPVDDSLLAEAGRARPPVGRRGARSQESAERDDDSSRAAAAAVRCPRVGRAAAAGRRRAPLAGRRRRQRRSRR